MPFDITITFTDDIKNHVNNSISRFYIDRKIQLSLTFFETNSS